MVNRPRVKGTMAETAVVGYLRTHGFPHAERRSLHGALDWGDITGTIGLAWEVKYANFGLQLASWLQQTNVERLNSGADHGILVVKPNGLGETKVHQWYAIMTAADFAILVAQVAGSPGLGADCSDPSLFVVDSDPEYYSSTSLRHRLHAATKSSKLGANEIPALTLRPPKTKDRPEAWYRVLTLEHMVRLIRKAGYGDPEHEPAREPDALAPAGTAPEEDQGSTGAAQVGHPAG